MNYLLSTELSLFDCISLNMNCVFVSYSVIPTVLGIQLVSGVWFCSGLAEVL